MCVVCSRVCGSCVRCEGGRCIKLFSKNFDQISEIESNPGKFQQKNIFLEHANDSMTNSESLSTLQ